MGGAHGDRTAYTFFISRACRVLLIKGLLNNASALPSKDKQCGSLLAVTQSRSLGGVLVYNDSLMSISINDSLRSLF